ncbi:MAG: amino acid adenylation domain-containing protein, partial [Proteobacteria bacterium]|nr:amino acid adenylation domain-containing protein [Pseudomonadota bacterium]
DSAPNGGRIDWAWSAQRIARLVRACEWGSVPNDFGRVTAAVPGRPAFEVASATCVALDAEPGTVLASDAESVTVACGEGAVRLTWRPGYRAADSGRAVRRSSSGCAPAESATRNASNVVTWLADRARQTPDAAAIVERGQVTTHGMLSQRAGAMANALQLAGVQPEDGVGILLPAGAEFIAAALGAMTAGACYVPLGLSSPPKRREVEVAEAGITHVVTMRQWAGAVPSAVPVVLMDALPGAARASEAAAIDGDACAYRIFTSGSTGRPKAVEIPHSALANLIDHYRHALALAADDRMSMLAHPTFDASVADIWPILAAGGAVNVPPAGLLRDPPALRDWLVASRCTCAFVPTAIGERLIAMEWPRDTALRTLLTGGEALHGRPRAGLPFRLMNTYGPTENTVDSLWAEIGPGSGRPPIGRPLRGVSARVVDATGADVAPGTLGELVLGGAQVARGYRGQPELTAERFEADPHAPGRRRYRTGDRVCVGADGEFEFHGRIDDQVQLLGVRVEPGEIAALLMADARVQEAVCLPVLVDDRAVGLVAHVVPATSSRLDPALAQSLLARLGEQLPPAVLPRECVLHVEFPRTTAGKVDRHALRALAPSTAEGAAADGDPVATIWHRVLAHAQGDVTRGTFWEHGGDSLGVMDLLLAVETQLGVRVPVGHFLAAPTLAGLRALARDVPRAVVTELCPGATPPLVCWYGLSGDLEPYARLVSTWHGRRLLGILSPAMAIDAARPDSIETAAREGLAALRRAGVHDAPAMLGYSWSGKVAFEAARQLAAAGTPSPFVGLVGSLPPLRPRSPAGRLWRVLRWGPATVLRRLRKAPPTPARVAKAFRRLAWMLGTHGATPETTQRRAPLAEALASVGYRYCPPADQRIVIHLFRDTASRDRVMDLGYYRLDHPDMGWGEWAGAQPVVHWIDCDHESLLKEPHVRRVADTLAVCLEQVAPRVAMA